MEERVGKWVFEKVAVKGIYTLYTVLKDEYTYLTELLTIHYLTFILHIELRYSKIK